ncbi:MAG: amidohydrolase family protein, partial [Candidatus Omnitrophica bacterium]|nr:amidohydrolase family protein [Candidatus Omnitrophota bacterium]MBD3268740.1 amidohydrolase family protein [Candidatus Omnitrophota bacterium]
MAKENKIIIRGANIVNSQNTKKADILIANGKIVEIKENIQKKGAVEIKAHNKHVLPGFIDIHTHLRTPGREDEEDLLSGSQAAAKGGFVKIFCMPNTQPPIDNEGVATWIIKESRRIGLVDIYPVGAITKGRKGVELSEFGSLKKSGCLSLSDDGDPVESTLLMRRALEYARMYNLLIVSHCEDRSLSQAGSMRESFVSSKYGISSVPDISESLRVARDIEIARYLNSPIHICHVSTAKSLQIIKRAKEKGVAVSCETCPHYFSLTLEDILANRFDANFKVNPPLGDKTDLEAVRRALKEGTIDCIASDHAPHSRAEKELPFEDAPFGMVGLELVFSLANTYLVKKGCLSLNEVSRRLSLNPALLYGFKNNGSIEEGKDADLVIADTDSALRVCEEELVS